MSAQNITGAALGAVLTLASGSCVDPAAVAALEADHKEILQKLEALEKRAPAPAVPKRRVERPDPKKTYAFPVGKSAIKGPKDAWVTIVEVSDFQCPYCKRVGGTLAQIEKTYGDDVRFVFKHNALSFHQRAKPAARAAECAKEQGKFWEMHDAIFESQRQLADANLASYAEKLGLDTQRWRACYDSKRHDALIDADQRQATILGARGTPAFYINGRFLSGAVPFEHFKKLIDEELAKAKASGVPKGDYYEKVVVGRGAKRI